MDNAENGIIRLQPEQLYDIIVAYRNFYPTCINGDYISEFGIYTDQQSVSCAINDLKKILQNAKGTIEITLEPLKQQRENEIHVPYLHDMCANNTYFAHFLGIDNAKGNITFSSLIKNTHEMFKKHEEMLMEVAMTSMDSSYDTLDNMTQPYEIIHPKTRVERRALLRLEFLHMNSRDNRLCEWNE